MPFIAIALALTLFLGGSAAVAQTPQGHAATSHVVHAWNTFEAKITGRASVVDADADGSTYATSTAQTNNARIRTDADANAAGSVNANTNEKATLNADGSVKVNVF